jgi:hypothetical protein
MSTLEDGSAFDDEALLDEQEGHGYSQDAGEGDDALDDLHDP